MNTLKLVIAVGLIAAVATSASAVTFLQPYTGPITIKLRNWDVGTIYGVQDGTYTGESNLNALPQLAPPNKFGIEDSWGIVQLTEIRGASNELLWSAAISGTPEITGMFWGERDTYLKQTTDGSGRISQEIHGVGLHFALYEDAANNFTNGWDTVGGQSGTNRRTAAATFLAATDGNLLWTGNSCPGFDPTFATDEFFTTFSPSGAIFGGLNAFGGFYVDLGAVAGLGTGSGNSMFQGTQNDGKVDWRVAFTGKPDSRGVYNVLSDDPIDATVVVPEPITMLGMFLGVSGVAGYIRKRRKA